MSMALVQMNQQYSQSRSQATQEPGNEATVQCTYCYDYEAEQRPENEQQWPLLRDDIEGNR